MVLAAVIGLLTAIVFDYFFFRWTSGINTGFRAVMLLAFAGTIRRPSLVYRRVLSPLTVPLSTDDMALSVEREFPELNDNLISTVQLTRILAHDQSISAPMVEEVARQAHQSTASLDFNRVVKFDRIKPGALRSAGAIWPGPDRAVRHSPMSRLRRPPASDALFNPFSKARYPELTHIAINGEQL